MRKIWKKINSFYLSNGKELTDKLIKKGYIIKNPLISKKEYFNKKSQQHEKLELLEHQKKFIRKFLLSNP